jgi:serine phosphatase RsbU (regulator of sigma subunit)
MAPKTADPGLGQIPPDGLVRELVTELGKAFDLSTALGDRTLGAAVEDRIRTLELGGTPEWGTDGSLKQLAKEESGALDFYYRPHLFPGMDPALRLGHRLQFDLLPRYLPEKSPLRIAALLESYCHLSGDLLGWRLEGNELFLWIVDVSGHGVRAGLAAATLYFLIDSIEEGLPPALFAERINEGVLAARNSDDPRALFATAIFLRVASGAPITYSSAGHNPMVLLRSEGEVEDLNSTGTPLGLIARQTFDERRFELARGDALCLFTDGLVEARNPDEQEFGTDRLVEVCSGWVGSPTELTHAIYRAVREHQTTSLLDDDLTLMVVQGAGRD